MEQKRPNLLAEAAAGLVGLIVCMVAFVALLSIEVLRQPLLWAALLFYLLMAGLMLYLSINKVELSGDVREGLARGEAGDFHLVGLPAMVCFGFLASCCAVDANYPGSFTGAPALGGADVSFFGYCTAWLLYLLDNLARVLLFDAFETFYVTIAPIRHADSFLTSLFVFSFRTVLAASLITYLLTTGYALRSRATR